MKSKIFLTWFFIGLFIEISLGMLFPERRGSSATIIDFVLLPLPFILFFYFLAVKVIKASKSKLLSH